MSLKTELEAILHHSAIAPLNDRAFLRVTGSDATRWLNGMVTNSVQTLQPGEGCYNFILNAQGRILGDCTIYYARGEPLTYLLETGASQIDSIQQHLDHFIIMDDVELTNGFEIVGHKAQGLFIVGATAAQLVRQLLSPVSEDDEPSPLPNSKPGKIIFAELPDKPHMFLGNLTKGLIIVLVLPATSIPSCELWFENEKDLKHLFERAESAGATQVSTEALEALRLYEGRPLYGRDITDKYLPQETNQSQALHFNKGCYLGQEIVERIRSRGQVHRLLTPLTLTGSMPTEFPAPLEADGKPVGEITSADLVPLPEGDRILALGYVRREALDTHAALSYSGGTATARPITQVQTADGASK
jgi:folate-binding protein YgfZ